MGWIWADFLDLKPLSTPFATPEWLGGSLSLEMNGLGDAGCKKLLEGNALPPSLGSLELGWNQISGASAEAFRQQK